MRVMAGIIIALVLAVAGVSWHDIHETRAAAKAIAARDDAHAANVQLQLTLQTERNNTAAANAVAAQYEKDKAHAEQTATSIAADLRAARIRLRPVWRCPAATAVPAASTGTGQPHAVTDVQAAAAAAVVRVGADADAQVKALQAFIRSQQPAAAGTASQP
ncbi:hypothetical protein [Frateuria aurantia]|uniref:hypothetical protein n=1 Tax=Frateuria aurantia TaxID=81475 RepID=UPI0002463748|nr:hypothetical protein [Frateuria aurantia]